MIGMREKDTLQGWSVGYSDEISAHAATRTLKPKNGRKRLLVMTQDDHEPHNAHEPVELGLYELDDEDNWELVEYEDFDTMERAVRAVHFDPKWT